MSPESLQQLVTTAGPVALVLAWGVIAFIKGWIVPGYIHRRAQQEKQDLLDAVLQSTEAAKLALQTSRTRERGAERR